MKNVYVGPLAQDRAKSIFLIIGPHGNFSHIYLEADLIDTAQHILYNSTHVHINQSIVKFKPQIL